VIVAAVSMMVFTVVSVTTFNRNDRSIFGYKMYIVNSDSMAKTDFDAGSLIFVKEVEPQTLKEGDIITFISQDTDSFGETVTHKIRKLTKDSEGQPGFVTYGTTTDSNDETIVTYPYVLGKYQFAVPHLGTFFNFLKTTPGYFVCIFTPFMLIIIYEAVKFFGLFKRYKQEQNDELKAQKDEIEAERIANAKILEELKALKAQMDEAKISVPQNTENTQENQNTEAKDLEEPNPETEINDPIA